MKFYNFLVLLTLVTFSTLVNAKNYQVIMKSISYEPKSLQIQAGDTVEWVNKSYTQHSADFDKDEKATGHSDTGLVEPKKTSKKMSFKEAGHFPYHCDVHGPTMSGEIIVTNASTDNK